MPDELLPHLRRARDLADRCYADPLDLDTDRAEPGPDPAAFEKPSAGSASYGPSGTEPVPNDPGHAATGSF